MTTRIFAVGILMCGLAPAAWGQQATAPPPARPVPDVGYQPPPQKTPAPAAPTPEAFDSYRSGPQGFSVVLVLGDMQANSAADSVPPAARKALTDMKDFLPYKGYRLLDVQWTLCCGRSPVISRLRGADEQEYELELTPNVIPNLHQGLTPVSSTVSVRFILREPPLGESEPKANAAEIELAELRRKQVDLEKKYPPQHPEVVANGARIKALTQDLSERRSPPRRPGASRAVIDASFRMDVGETVVVGTSRVKGGEKALIALLTAVPQKTASAR